MKQEYYQGTLQLMKYNSAKRSVRYTGTPPAQHRPAPIPEESPYYSSAYPNSLARQRSEGGHQECPYESLHILDRPIPEDRELGERDPLRSVDPHQAETLPVASTSGTRRGRVADDEDIYNPSIAST